MEEATKLEKEQQKKMKPIPISELHTALGELEEREKLGRRLRWVYYHVGRLRASVCGAFTKTTDKTHGRVFQCRWHGFTYRSRYLMFVSDCFDCEFDPLGDVKAFHAKVVAKVLAEAK